jgi:hypothetical protein
VPVGGCIYIGKYSLLDMHTVELAQDTPDALVLAILCNFRGKPAQYPGRVE